MLHSNDLQHLNLDILFQNFDNRVNIVKKLAQKLKDLERSGKNTKMGCFNRMLSTIQGGNAQVYR